MIKSYKQDYQDGQLTLEGYCAFDDSITTPRPAILICHDWSGKNELACKKADQLAELGYIGFALDMFGKGILGRTKEEKGALIQPLLQDRAALLQRILAAVHTVKQLPQVNPQQIAAIGFCFGGLCVLDLARSGADIAGVISFHGLLNPPANQTPSPIKAKVLVLHGYDDPMVPPDTLKNFADEMTQAKANWEINIYGHTTHAFTNPEANDPAFGTVYNKQADQRSWLSMIMFLKEIFK